MFTDHATPAVGIEPAPLAAQSGKSGSHLHRADRRNGNTKSKSFEDFDFIRFIVR